MNDPAPVDDVLAVWSNGIRLRPAEIAAMHRTILSHRRIHPRADLRVGTADFRAGTSDH
jgi:hypothetical protein